MYLLGKINIAILNEYPQCIYYSAKSIVNQYPFENEIGFSSSDLTLISINKITEKSKTYINHISITTLSI